MRTSKSVLSSAEVLDLIENLCIKSSATPRSILILKTDPLVEMVINIGFATIDALIGAGDYGQSILTGIRLDDYNLIVEGAIPAALLAKETFELHEKRTSLSWTSRAVKDLRGKSTSDTRLD